MMVTIKDIAEKAGVSSATVSHVIHGKTTRVSKATIEKINQIIKEMNYIPNMGARILAGDRSKIIGVVTNVLSEAERGLQSPFIAEILGAIEYEIQEQGYYMMLYSSRSVEEIETLISTWNVDGIITVGLDTKACRKFGKLIQVPAVYTDCYFKSEEPYMNVGTEDAAGSYMAVKYLIEHGHRRIGYISDSEPVKGAAEGVGDLRELGYEKALNEAGIPFSQDNIFVGSNEIEKQNQMFEQVYKRLDEYTALAFCSDYFAISAIDYLCHKGVRIPGDVSIIGFDDIDMARISAPRLTTVRQGVAEKGKVAVRQLLKQINNEEIDKKCIRIAVSLIERESVKKIYVRPL